MWQAIYYLGIKSYSYIIHISALFNPKAKKWVEGRKAIFNRLQKTIPENQTVIWFHCASLGEFEQGRPLIEAYRKNYPAHFILLTFYSPSGYEIRKNYSMADAVFYLPQDSPSNARKFLDIVHPEKVFFVKYEFWHYYIRAMYKRGIPLYMVSAIFRESQVFFKPWGSFFRKILRKVSWFFVQDDNSANLLQSIGIDEYTISGDTRFDRVLELAGKPAKVHGVDLFIQNQPVFIAGSTWPKDESIILGQIDFFYRQGWKVLLVPHEVEETHIRQIISKIPSDIKYASYSDDTSNWQEADILVVNKIGLLSGLYQYASLAYIGGGFGKGIHNILEAATYSLPVIFGPHHKQFKEAVDLLRLGGAFCIEGEQYFIPLLKKFLEQPTMREKAGSIARQYVEQQSGATSAILSHMDASGNKK